MIKKLILFLLAVAAVYGAVLSPYNLPAALDKKANLEQALVSKAQASTSRDSARASLSSAKNAFDSQRTFEIAYTDLGRIKKMLDAVTGVSFSGIEEVDPANGYALVGPLNIEDYADGAVLPPSAVKLSVVAENTAAGLRVINTMQLPLVSIDVQEPGRMEIIFLTGGES